MGITHQKHIKSKRISDWYSVIKKPEKLWSNVIWTNGIQNVNPITTTPHIIVPGYDLYSSRWLIKKPNWKEAREYVIVLTLKTYSMQIKNQCVFEDFDLYKVETVSKIFDVDTKYVESIKIKEMDNWVAIHVKKQIQ